MEQRLRELLGLSHYGRLARLHCPNTPSAMEMLIKIMKKCLYLWNEIDV